MGIGNEVRKEAGTLGARLWSLDFVLQGWGAAELSDGGICSELCFRMVSLQDRGRPT